MSCRCGHCATSVDCHPLGGHAFVKLKITLWGGPSIDRSFGRHISIESTILIAVFVGEATHNSNARRNRLFQLFCWHGLLPTRRLREQESQHQSCYVFHSLVPAPFPFLASDTGKVTLQQR
jgi:hypothetical protein